MVKNINLFFAMRKLTLAILALCLLHSFSSCSQKQTPAKPNVLIILSDDLGYGDLSCYGQQNYKTPNVDKLANEGVKFTDFYVPTPYCAPSRATLLTGRFPLRHGLVTNPTPDAGINDVGLEKEEITLGEVFQQAGYATKLIGKWHLGHKEKYFPVNHGFDEYYGILYSNDMRPVQHIENCDTVEYPIDQNTLTTTYTQKAIEFITRNKEKPFFLHLCHPMPHKPLAVSERFYTPDTKDDLYADVIRELDWSVGQIVNTLNDLGILDNTIIIFMSDNGPWYGGSTGGLKGMKATSWEGGIRVPMIVRYPSLFNPATVEVPCWSPDIFPTLLSLTGVKPEKINQLDGVDITNVLKAQQREHPAIFSLVNDHIVTVRKGKYKLFIDWARYERLPLDWVDPRRPDGKTIIAPFEQPTTSQYPGVVPEKPVNKIQLFDVKNDIAESHDLSKEMPEKVAELMKEYETFQASFNLKSKNN